VDCVQHHVRTALCECDVACRVEAWWLTTVYGLQSEVDKVVFSRNCEICGQAIPWLYGDFEMIYRAEDKNNQLMSCV
jgi:hypothetical protein